MEDIEIDELLLQELGDLMDENGKIEDYEYAMQVQSEMGFPEQNYQTYKFAWRDKAHMPSSSLTNLKSSSVKKIKALPNTNFLDKHTEF